MKKKFINGILMVALVGATSTSFVSCKDTSEDVKTDLLAQVNAVKADLTPRVEKAESDISNLQGRMTTAEGNITTLQTEVGQIKNRVSKLEEEKDSLAQVTKTIEGQLSNVESQINTIVYALENMVTSVNVNATSTSILENSKVFPGINAQFLGAAYGIAANRGQFPSTDADDYIAGHGVVLTANDIKAVDGAIEWKGNDYLPVEASNAGTVFFTLNPSNIDATAAEKISLSLINSKDETSFVEIGAAEAADVELQWGNTRAANPVKLWKAAATINLEDAETKEQIVDPTKIIDFKGIANNFKNMLRDNSNAAKQSNSAVAKEVLKASAQIVATLLESEAPSLPALALKAEWEDTVGTRSVISDYSIAATAYKPLSFSFGNDLGLGNRQISLDKIDAAVAKFVNRVQDKANQLDLKLQSLKFDLGAFDNIAPGAGTNFYLVFTTDATGKADASSVVIKNATGTATDATTVGVFAANTEYYFALGTGDAVFTAVPVAALNELANEALNVIADANQYAERAKNLEVRITNYLENFLNKVIFKLSTDGLTRVLEPVLLYQSDKGVFRMADGNKVKAGAEIDLLPTTMTKEIIAPAYKKYIAIIGKDGKVREAIIKTKGEKDFNKWTVKIEEGDKAIVYSALDYSGKQIAKKYSIKVVK